MGNCCTTKSSMEWGGDDWSSLRSKNKKTRSSKVFDEGQELNAWHAEKRRLQGALRASSDANGKVKIKISKKDLEELLRGNQQQQQKKKKPQGRLSAEQVLVRLLNTGDHVSGQHHAHHRPWRPVLQTIPEIN